MDCKTAHLLIEFTRPHAAELAPDEAAELDAHLLDCPGCQHLFHLNQRLDQHLGKAMLQVDVPDRLHAHIRARLHSERHDWYRRWATVGLRIAGAAAAALLLAWGIWQWRQSQLPAVDVKDLLASVNHITQSKSPEQVEEFFRQNGYEVRLPRNLNYGFLASHGFAEFQGQQVPHLLFIQRPDDRAGELLQVYILSQRQFNLASLKQPQPMDHGYRYKVDVRYREGDTLAFVFVHTSDHYDWCQQR